MEWIKCASLKGQRSIWEWRVEIEGRKSRKSQKKYPQKRDGIKIEK